MRISVERDRFADTIGWVLRSVSSRATLPALGGVLFDANGPQLRLAGTDLELAGEATIDAKIDEKGSVVLPGRVLGEIARSLPEGAVRIESSGGQAKLTCGAAEFTLRALALEDFPNLAAPEGAPSGKLDASLFAAAVGQVTRAASHDEARPVLTGTLVDVTPDKITLVSTDSYRLSVREIAWSGPSTPLKRVIPARALSEAARASDGDGEIEITLGESQASFAVAGRRLTTRLIEGEFPNWSQLIPAELPNQLRLERESFAEAVRSSRSLARRCGSISAQTVRSSAPDRKISAKRPNRSRGSSKASLSPLRSIRRICSMASMRSREPRSRCRRGTGSSLPCCARPKTPPVSSTW
jgi:DNA polymerase-3 subunit beta